jgi:hypothetical protein
VSLLAASIKCKESREIARKFTLAPATFYAERSRRNLPRQLGKPRKHAREFREGDRGIRRRGTFLWSLDESFAGALTLLAASCTMNLALGA